MAHIVEWFGYQYVLTSYRSHLVGYGKSKRGSFSEHDHQMLHIDLLKVRYGPWAMLTVTETHILV